MATEPAQDYSRYSRSHLLVMSRGPTLAELDNVNGGDKVGRVGGRLLTNGD